MGNRYMEMKQRQQEELNAFPCFFAFNNDQFVDGMKKLGLKPTDTKLIYRSMGGMYYRKSDSQRLSDMYERFHQEIQQAIAEDATGDGFTFELFDYELSNHEYIVTMDVTDAINASPFTWDEILENTKLLYALKKACDNQREWHRKHG